MRSERAKVLHELAGEPMLLRPIRAAFAAGAGRVVVVVGHQAQDVVQTLRASFGAQMASGTLVTATQLEQRGTGDAVRCAMPHLEQHDGRVWISSGDVPLLRATTLVHLADACERSPAKLAFAVFRPDSATGYGRVLRDESGRVLGIREERDASPEQRAIGECNAGVYCVDASRLRALLPQLGRDNVQGELYLTDLVELATRSGRVEVVEVAADEVRGVNTPEQLAAIELELKR